MTTSLKKSSLDNITKSDILRLCDKLWNADKDKLRRCLLSIFRRRENIHLFGWFVARKYFPLESPPFHLEILNLISDKTNRRLGFVAPRGHAKSTVVNFAYSLWAGCFKQEEFVVIVSDTYTQAEEFVEALRDEFENNPVIKWLFGEMRSNRWQLGEFVLSNDTKFIAKGSGMKIRGIRHRHVRPSLIIFDDMENDENIESAEQRAKLYKWFTKAAIPALSRDGRAVIIGTILHFDSLMNKVSDGKDIFASWVTRKFFAITTSLNGAAKALWPEHRDLSKLKSIRDDPKDPDYIGSLVFAQEYQHKPFNEDDAIIKPEWINEIEPSMVPDSRFRIARIITIDPAASERQTADPSAMVVADLDADGKVYVRAVFNKRVSPSKLENHIRNWQEVYDPDRIGIEEGALGLVFRDLLAGLPIIGLKPDKDKVRRLLAVSKFFESGRVFLVNGINNGQALREQLTEFPKGSHDDMVDALAYAIRLLLVDGVSNDEEVEMSGDYSGGKSLDANDEYYDDENYGAY